MQASISRVESGASGFGGVPGYITPSGMAKIMLHLRHRCRMRGKGSLFCDIGCGEGRPVMAIMEGCPRIGGVVGLDVDDITLHVTRRNMERFRNLSWNGEHYKPSTEQSPPDPTPPSCILHSDVTHLRDLGCVTHAYTFCNGMPSDVLRHIFRVCASTDTLRYVVLVYKKLSGDEAYELVKDLQETSASSVHAFVGEGSGSSLLHMPKQTAHGCCIHMSAAVRAAMLRASQGVVANRPVETLEGCFVTV